jgi:hypothetical protein
VFAVGVLLYLVFFLSLRTVIHSYGEKEVSEFINKFEDPPVILLSSDVYSLKGASEANLLFTIKGQ